MFAGRTRASLLFALLAAVLLAAPSAAAGGGHGPETPPDAPEASPSPSGQPTPGTDPSVDPGPVTEDDVPDPSVDGSGQPTPTPPEDPSPVTGSRAPKGSRDASGNQEGKQERSGGGQTFACQNGFAGPFPCKNVDVESIFPLGGAGAGNGNDVWGWTDPKTDREYALVGSALETTFIDVTNPQNPRNVGSLPTSGVADFILWRDIKVDGNFAFIVSEHSGHGMQVFDLRRLRGVEGPRVFEADTVYRGADEDGEELGYAHNIAINEETDFAYVVGSNTCVSRGPDDESDEDDENGGLHMVDISDPLNPEFAGCVLVTDPPTNNYVHDVQCVIYRGPDADYRGREICFGSNEDVVTIYDVTDKDNPVVISQRGYPQASYTHQGWLTEDHRFFLFGDELDEMDGKVENTTTYIMSTSNLDVPRVPKAFKHKTRSIDHNLYIDNGLVYQSNYGAGLRILDFSNRSLKKGQLNEVGFLDIRPGFDEPEFVGTWSNYPYFESGIVVMTGIEEGSTVLYVLRPTGKAAGGDKKDPDKDPDKKDPDKKDPDKKDPDGDTGGLNERGPTEVSDQGGGPLAFTGAELMLFLALALALIVAGVVFRRLGRSRAADELG